MFKQDKGEPLLINDLRGTKTPILRKMCEENGYSIKSYNLASCEESGEYRLDEEVSLK